MMVQYWLPVPMIVVYLFGNVNDNSGYASSLIFGYFMIYISIVQIIFNKRKNVVKKTKINFIFNTRIDR